jgi:hypothetical protein
MWYDSRVGESSAGERLISSIVAVTSNGRRGNGFSKSSDWPAGDKECGEGRMLGCEADANLLFALHRSGDDGCCGSSTKLDREDFLDGGDEWSLSKGREEEEDAVESPRATRLTC